MNKGLSKFQIDKFFKDEKNEEIKKKKKTIWAFILWIQ